MKAPNEDKQKIKFPKINKGFIPDDNFSDLMNKEHEEFMKLAKKAIHQSFWGTSKPSPSNTGDNQDNLKWAIIMVQGKQEMCWVDNVTHKAYKRNEYAKTNIEIKEFTFVRWCTGLDL